MCCVRILETIHQGLICYYVYYLTVLHYGEVDTIGTAPMPICIAIALAGFIGMIVQVRLRPITSCVRYAHADVVQMFFAYRIFLFSHRSFIPVLSWVLSIIRLGWAIVCAVYLSRAGSMSVFSDKYGWVLDALLGLHVVVDTLIAACRFSTLSGRKTDFGTCVFVFLHVR